MIRYLLFLMIFSIISFIAWNYWGFLFFINIILLFISLECISNKNFFLRFVFSWPIFILFNISVTFWLFNVDPLNSLITFLTNSVIQTFIFILISYINYKPFDNKIAFIIIWPLSEWLLTKWDLAWPWLIF